VAGVIQTGLDQVAFSSVQYLSAHLVGLQIGPRRLSDAVSTNEPELFGVIFARSSLHLTMLRCCIKDEGIWSVHDGLIPSVEGSSKVSI
jgi:hypothetical protein